MIPHFTNTTELIRWVSAVKHPEEIEDLLAISDGVVSEVVFRYAPKRVLSLVSVRERLETVDPWQAAPGWLMALADNEDLDGLIQQMLFSWAHEQTREVTNKLINGPSPRPNPSGEVAAMQLVRRLEMTGYSRPAWLMDHIRASVKSWRKKKDPNVVQSKWALARGKEDEEKEREWHAALLLADWVSLKEEDTYAVFRALKESESALAKLMRHPSVQEKTALYILREKLRSPEVLRAWFSRPDLLKSEALREEVIFSGDRSVYRYFIPHATSEEFVRMVVSDGLKAAAQMGARGLSGSFGLLEERAPTPHEAAAIIRGIARRFPEETIVEAQKRIPVERLTELDNEDFLPLMSSERSEVRLEAQRLWSQVERERAKRERDVVVGSQVGASAPAVRKAVGR